MLVKGRIRTVNRSDLFIVMINVNVGFMYVMASSCGLKGKTKTPAGKAYATRRLIDRPQKAKSCTEIHSGVTSNPTSSFITFVRL